MAGYKQKCKGVIEATHACQNAGIHAKQGSAAEGAALTMNFLTLYLVSFSLSVNSSSQCSMSWQAGGNSAIVCAWGNVG